MPKKTAAGHTSDDFASLMARSRPGQLKLSELIPTDSNPRAHDEAQVAMLVKSIRRHGMIRPIMVQEGTNKIVAGHGTRLALLRLAPNGTDPLVPVVFAKLSDAEAASYMVADNRFTDLSTWNLPSLKEIVVGLDDGAFDFEALGFTELDLNQLFPVEMEKGPKMLGDPDDAPACPEEPFSKLGDLWLMGTHRLLCGDATVPADVARLMNEEEADLILTDPPYGVDWQNGGRQQKRLKRDGFSKIEGDKLEGKALEEFLVKAFACAVAASKPNAPWYVWHSFHGQREFQSSLEACGLTIRAQIIWVKPSAGLGQAEFRSRHENAFVAGQKDKDIGLVLQEHGLGWFGHRLGAKPPTWLGERRQTSVWECGRDNAKTLVHLTQKPVELLLRAMRLSSLPRNLVLDLFAGSGSTLAACEVASRRCNCMELDEANCDVIVHRWQNLTGRKATLLRDGKEIPGAMPKEKK